LHSFKLSYSKLRDFVETYNSQASMQQKHHYDGHSSSRTFVVNDHVWLSVPTVGKLDPRWEGGWIIQAVKSSITWWQENPNCTHQRIKTNASRNCYIRWNSYTTPSEWLGSPISGAPFYWWWFTWTKTPLSYPWKETTKPLPFLKKKATLGGADATLCNNWTNLHTPCWCNNCNCNCMISVK